MVPADVRPLKSALSRTPRHSRCSTPKRRVSFGKLEKDGGSTPGGDVAEQSDVEKHDQGLCSDTRERGGTSEAEPEKRELFGKSDKPLVNSDDEVEPEPEQIRVSPKKPLVNSDDDEHEQFERQILPEICFGHNVDKVGMFFHLPPREARVTVVTEGSWAEEYGVQPGDLVVAVNGKKVRRLDGNRVLAICRERPLRLLLEREVPISDPPSPASPPRGKSPREKSLRDTPSPASPPRRKSPRKKSLRDGRDGGDGGESSRELAWDVGTPETWLKAGQAWWSGNVA